MIELDLGAEDWRFPDARELSVPDAVRLWDRIEREARETNARAARLKARKAAAKNLALVVLDASDQTSARVEVSDGREIQITPYSWDVFSVKDEAAFREWAAGEAERYYDAEPRLRDAIFQEEMRRRAADGEPMPPGVIRWTDTRISRSAVPKRRRPPTPKPDILDNSG